MRHRAYRAAVVVSALLAACAGGVGPPAAPSPADLAALETRRAENPSDAAVLLELARAYHAAGRYAEARDAARGALGARPGLTEAEAYLGLAYEGLERFDSARAVYTRLLARRPGGRVARLLRGRMVLLTSRELRADARRALARETELSALPPDPGTVAVFPFRYTGADSTLRPLERGLAALVVTDLSQIRRLRLVERERLQALLDELALAAEGRVDPATAARSGKLVRAGHVVQGQFQDAPPSGFRIDAAVVRAADAEVAAAASAADRLRALFDLEKRVVLELLERLGIAPTPAELAAISERPTRDVQAFLLYSRGLEAKDRGDFDAAARHFQAAAARDPGFQAATQQLELTGAAAAAAGAPPTAVAGGDRPAAPGGSATRPAESGTLLAAINEVVPTGALALDAASTTVNRLPPIDPSRLCEVNDCAGPQRLGFLGTLIILIPRP